MLKGVNSLSYLYDDLDFIFEKDAQSCPGTALAFFKNFDQYKLSCSRIIYRDFDIVNHQILISTNGSPAATNLLINNHGHAGLPGAHETWALELFFDLLKNGYDILIVSMPYSGIDAMRYPAKVKTSEGVAVYDPLVLTDPIAGGNHSPFELYDTGKSHYMRFFLDNVVIGGFNFHSKYKKISYLGLSGGATTGLYACALLQEIIDQCILVAGVMPANLRFMRSTFGDAEQISSSFHLRNPVMKIVQEISSSNTKLSLLYNNRDNCCFDELPALQFKEMLRERSLLNTIIFSIRESSIHGYDPLQVKTILNTQP